MAEPLWSRISEELRRLEEEQVEAIRKQWDAARQRLTVIAFDDAAETEDTPEN